VDRTIDSAADRPAPLVVVAALNEADRIEATLAALRRTLPDASIWVADDGSTDATAELARRAGATVHSTGRVIGKGEAVASALALARAGLDVDSVVLLCDGDLGASAARLGALVDEVRDGRADLAVAAFATRVGGGFGLALGFARWAIERRCGLRTRAPISGQRAMNARAIEAVLPLASGFGMEVGMTIDAVRAGCRVLEIELDLEHRATGRTAGGFAHRARQLLDFARVYVGRRRT
jgi:glycosyltransferase involved in cell wall biosynthesis